MQRVAAAADGRLMVWLGRVGVGIFLVHVAYCAAAEHWSEAFWACHVAFLVLSMGMWFGWVRWVSVGALCLLAGTPAWLANVAAGLPVGPTSAATHLGGVVLALVGLRRVGVARGAWLFAVLFLGFVQCASRLTPAARNINAAFAVYEPLQPFFSNYWSYEAALAIVALAVLFGLEAALRRCVGVAPRAPA